MPLDNSVEYIHIAMRPGLTFIFLKYLREEKWMSIRRRHDARQPDSEAALPLKRIQPSERIWVVLGHEFEPILKGHDYCGVHPPPRSCSQLLDEFIV